MLVLKIAVGVVLGVSALLIGLSALYASGTSSSDTTAAATASADDPTWTWVSFPRCTYHTGQCWQIKVTAQADCTNGLYAEVNLLDAGGDVIGYTNDSLGSLAAGRTAVMSFDTFDRKAKSAEVTEVTCHR